MNRGADPGISSRDSLQALQTSLGKLERYLLEQEYRGYDPYDALCSPLFRLPILRTNAFLRWSSQQVLKRLPVNLRPLLRIRKGLNPVTLGLAIEAYAHVPEDLLEGATELRSRVIELVGRLEGLKSQGFSGACWGYDFDWEARYGRFPAYTPTVVATGIITNGLFAAYERFGLEPAFELCKSAVKFVVNDLHRTCDGDSFCWSYSPFDRQCVYNASMKGARLLAQVYSVTREPELQELARAAVKFVVRHQQADGGWSYSRGDDRTWIDNFHTGYVLDCLKVYRDRTGDPEVDPALERGSAFYRAHFFTADSIPKYYSNRTFPVDATACAQSIITLSRMGDVERATAVALWTVSHLQLEHGGFAYRRHRRYVNRISYMRWSNAWMLVALSLIVRTLSSR